MRHFDPNHHYYQQGMQQPYPYPEQKPSIGHIIGYWWRVSIKVTLIAIVLWLLNTGYGIALTSGDSWSQKALNYFNQLKEQQITIVAEQNSSD